MHFMCIILFSPLKNLPSGYYCIHVISQKQTNKQKNQPKPKIAITENITILFSIFSYWRVNINLLRSRGIFSSLRARTWCMSIVKDVKTFDPVVTTKNITAVGTTLKIMSWKKNKNTKNVRVLYWHLSLAFWST